MPESGRKRRFHERWVDCAAAAAAYDQLSAQQREFKKLTELGPGLLARIRGREKKGVIRHTTLMHLNSIAAFAAVSKVPVTELLANGDGMNPLQDQRAATVLSEILENIRKNQFAEGRERLRKLEQSGFVLLEHFRVRILYNSACLESAYAEQLSEVNTDRQAALERSLRSLTEWLRIGLDGAWEREGRTARNEIHRMGSDSDLRYLLAERKADILARIPEDYREALPAELPSKRGEGMGGGCVPGYAAIQTPLGKVAASCLREGDQITSLELGSGSHSVTARAVQIHASRASECILINENMLFTASQPLYLFTGSLILAGDVKVGMRLLGASLPIRVRSKRLVSGYYEVYHLTTDHQTHNYLVYDGVLCHNKLMG
jgi:hypothetical protein